MAGIGWLAGGLLALAPLGAHFGVVRPLVGFGGFALGGLLGVITLIRSGIGIVRGTRLRASDWLGAAAGLAFVVAAVSSARSGAPRINDFTTSPGNPPRFEAIAQIPENAGRNMDYPRDFAAIQLGCCADLASVTFPQAPAEIMTQAVTVARDLFGWEIVAQDAGTGRLEAVSTPALFRFRDDVVIRVEPGPGGGSVVDVRSKSRDGQGDLGANANRIRAFLGALRARLSAG